MRSRESLRQLARIQSLGTMREKRARAALGRALGHHKDLALRLDDTHNAIVATEQERYALFEAHRGLMTRGDLYQLKRRESVLESRRIDLMLDRTDIEDALEQAQVAISQARQALTDAQCRHHKIQVAAGLFQRDVNLQDRTSEEHEIEERSYEN
ncbi:hypothetical protein [Achromobacter xylosoxidans]|uniref:hypothetical protein n=1 Tax=Alcaligenes xylosoxydans xylosoxydans TaxID=85698 RepID=UPI0022B8CA17|nr:hypothetical protein [Achromobacter xylosoxidans]MCZ8438935.1 hypothetical protein [Achromobacter xylosoxidans]